MHIPEHMTCFSQQKIVTFVVVLHTLNCSVTVVRKLMCLDMDNTIS